MLLILSNTAVSKLYCLCLNPFLDIPTKEKFYVKNLVNKPNQNLNCKSLLYRKIGPMSTEFDKNSSIWSYYSTDHKNYIKKFFEHFSSKLLDPQKSTFGDVILGIKLF